MSGSFFDAGLRFQCRRCSHCCRHEPGYVFLTQDDLERLAAGLELTPAEVRRATAAGADRSSAIEPAETPAYDRVLWGPGCRVWAPAAAVPQLPFWTAELVAEDWSSSSIVRAWAAACPGQAIRDY
jgi:hypothetical protein